MGREEPSPCGVESCPDRNEWLGAYSPGSAFPQSSERRCWRYRRPLRRTAMAQGTDLIASKNQPPRSGRTPQGPDKQGRQPAEPPGPQLVEVLPLDDRIVMLHFDEGHVVHHRRGMPRSDERVVASPLELTAAARATNYRITSADDPAYAGPRLAEQRRPQEQGDRLRLVRRPMGERPRGQLSSRPCQGALALSALPSPMVRGKSYTVNTGTLAANGRKWTLKFDEAKSRSEAVHVNLIGYRPMATQKYRLRLSMDGRPGLARPSASCGPAIPPDRRVHRPAGVHGQAHASRTVNPSKRHSTRPTRPPTATS